MNCETTQTFVGEAAMEGGGGCYHEYGVPARGDGSTVVLLIVVL